MVTAGCGYSPSAAADGEKAKQEVAVRANVSGAPAGAWSMFRGGPLAQGVSASSLPDQPELLWSRSFKNDNEAFEATAAIANGVVFIGGLNGPLYAFELKSGEEKWRFKSQAGFNAPATVKDGLLYIGDLDGVFYCLDAADGKEKWRYAEAEAEINNGANFYKGNVLFGSQDARLYCLNAKTGKPAWHEPHQTADQIRCFPTVVDNRAFVAGCDGELHIINLDTGKAEDKVSIGGPTQASPGVLDDVAYVGTEGETFFAVNWKKAEAVWQYQHPQRRFAYRSSAAVTKDAVVVGNRGKFVVALHPETGKELWTYVTRSGIDSSPVVVGENAYFGTARGRLYALNVKSGAKKWEYQAGGGFTASPAVAQGRLVIANDEGVVFCFGKK